MSGQVPSGRPGPMQGWDAWRKRVGGTKKTKKTKKNKNSETMAGQVPSSDTDTETETDTDTDTDTVTDYAALQGTWPAGRDLDSHSL